MILGVLAHAHGPFAIAARAAHHRQFQWLGAGDRGVQEILHRNNSFARSGADQCNRRTELTRQRQHIHVAALLAQLVSHVQQHQSRRAQRDHARRQHEVAVQVGGIQNQDDGVGARRAGHVSGQHINRDLLVFGLGRKTVNAREIDKRNLLPFRVAHVAGVMFDGDAGKIADLLAQTGKPIEKRGLAGIRRADDGNRAIRCAQSFVAGSRHRMAAHR